eukprot:771080-Rhodomonas_salina.3
MGYVSTGHGVGMGSSTRIQRAQAVERKEGEEAACGLWETRYYNVTILRKLRIGRGGRGAGGTRRDVSTGHFVAGT